MNKNIFLTLALVACPAFAHVDAGTFEGVTPSGAVCSLKSFGTSYLNDKKHPLNERVAVEVNAMAFSLQHPPVVNAQESVAHFDHDSFSAINPSDTGAVALVLNMSHAEGSKGPTSYSLITHAWRSGERSKVQCNGLVFKK